MKVTELLQENAAVAMAAANEVKAEIDRRIRRYDNKCSLTLTDNGYPVLSVSRKPRSLKNPGLASQMWAQTKEAVEEVIAQELSGDMLPVSVTVVRPAGSIIIVFDAPE